MSRTDREAVRKRRDAPMRQRSWRQKFADSLRGMKRGVRGQSSFFVHFFVAAAVVATAAVLRCDLVDWCLLLVCITVVLAAEMFNSSLESLARAIDQRPHIHLRDALDIASAAVLVCAIGAAVVGAMIFVHRLHVMLGG